MLEKTQSLNAWKETVTLLCILAFDEAIQEGKIFHRGVVLKRGERLLSLRKKNMKREPTKNETDHTRNVARRLAEKIRSEEQNVYSLAEKETFRKWRQKVSRFTSVSC